MDYIRSPWLNKSGLNERPYTTGRQKDISQTASTTYHSLINYKRCLLGLVWT